MATVGLYGSSTSGVVAAATGSESTGLYGNATSFGGSYFEWFIFQQADTQPATPTGGSWSFTTNSGTPPTGWSSIPPSAPTNKVWVSIALVNSKTADALTWSAPGLFSYSSGLPILSGNGTPDSGAGQSDQLYIQLDTTPQTIWFKESGTWTRLTGSTLYADLTSNQTIGGTKTFSSQIQGSVSGTASNVTGVVGIANGGTGSTTAAGARTALGAASSGANNDITSLSGITGAIGTADYVAFDTTYTTTLAAGQLGWDGNNTLGLGMAGGNVVQKIGEDQFYYIKASSAITKGQVVMFTGSVGASGVVTGAPATGVTDGSYIMGVAAETIALNGFGLVQFEGTLRGIDTSAFTDGAILWYNPAVTGGLTATQPSAPNVKVQMAAVINAGSGGSGSVLIRVTAGSVLGGTDSNVQFSTLANGNIIQYDSALGYWKNVAPSSLAVTTFSGGTTGLTPATATAGAITLGGTLAVANGGTGVTTSTGTGSVVLATSPTLVTPALGTPTSGNFSTGTFTWPTFNQNTTGTASNITATSNSTLTTLSALSLPGSQVTGNISGNAANVTGVVAIANGGTGQTTANAAFNALAPSQTGNAGKYLTTDGTNTSWATNPLGTVTSVAVSGGTTGLTTSGGPITSSGTITLAGTLATTNGGTGLTSFTANGVVYASSTSALTTGSALTFDGTNLGVGGAATSFGAGYSVAQVTGASGGYQLQSSGTVVSQVGADSGYAAVRIGTRSAHPIIFTYNDSEQMRLTSTGLGIGTSSPATKLDVTGAIHSTAGLVIGAAIDGTTGGFSRSGGDTYLDYAGILRFRSGAASERMYLDSSGNLGLGVTPSAWGYPAFQANRISVSGYSTGGGLTYNAYDSGGWKYIASDYASHYQQNSGAHKWLTAASGTAGAAISFTQAMTLDASGNLGVGTTSPSTRLHLYASANEILRLESSSTSYDAALRIFQNGTQITNLQGGVGVVGGGTILATVTSAPLVFGTVNTERARIDSSGNLLVGTTSTGNVNSNSFSVSKSSGYITVNHVNGTGSGTGYASFGYNAGEIGSITQSGTTAVAYNTSSDYRLKDNQAPLTGSGAFIDALQPKTWTWKADGSKGVGFIAHEVQAVSPSSVVGTKDAVDEEGKPIMQAMEYGSAEFIANIVAELQSLRARVAQLESKGA